VTDPTAPEPIPARPADPPPRKPALREPPEPAQADAVVPVTVGTALWAVALVVLVLLRDQLAESDATWWIAVAAAGFGLGLLGIWWVRRRRAAYERAGRAASGQSHLEPGL
jgi:hypothetical protein